MDVRDGARTGPGQAPSAAAASAPALRPNRPDDATYLHCGGCGTATLLAQRDRHYGRLVHDFLGRHGQCGGAVEISAARQQAARAANR